MNNKNLRKTSFFKKWWIWATLSCLIVIIIVVMLIIYRPSLSITDNSLNNTKDELLTVLNKNLTEENKILENFKEVKGNNEAEENKYKIYETLINNDVVIQCVEQNGKIQSVRTYSFLNQDNLKESTYYVGFILGTIIRELGVSEEESSKITTELSKDYTNGETENDKFIAIMQSTDYYATMIIIFNKNNVDLIKKINADETTQKLNELKQDDIIKNFNDSIKRIDELVKKETNSISDLKDDKTQLQELKSELEKIFEEYNDQNEYSRIEEEKNNWFNTIDELINYINSKIKVTVPDFSNMTSTEAEKWGKDNNITVTTATEYSDSIANGKIISQSIKVGETVLKGDNTIKVVYSIGRKPTKGELNALKKAQSYSDHQHMSKKRLYDQLTSSYGEGFSESEAEYAVDHVNVDWSYNALQKAKSYQSNLNMSKSRIYNQLISSYGEDFTESEAQYAIDHLED